MLHPNLVLVALATLSLSLQGLASTSAQEDALAERPAAPATRGLHLTAHDVDAQWSFPLPKGAALAELSLWIGERRVVGEVAPRAEARRIHEAEARAGAQTALAEQAGRQAYQVELGRVPAGGEARVRIVYFQPLDVDQGVGRYLYPLESGGTSETGLDDAFWSLSKEVEGGVTIDVTLKTAFRVEALHSPSHAELVATREAADLWCARWRGGAGALERDFVLHYRLAEDEPARIELLTSRDPAQAEGTFMAVVTPGDDLPPISGGTDWLFLLDVSGSMGGGKLRVLRDGVRAAIEGLGTDDRFQVLRFNSSCAALMRGWERPGTPEAGATLRRVAALGAGGSTDLFGALNTAYARLDPTRASAILLVSDGVATAGRRAYRDFLALAATHDARLFTFVMGNGADERLLGDLAVRSGGFAKSVGVRDEVGAHLLLARERMSHAAFRSVRFELEGATEVRPSRLPSLYLGQQLVVFGRYRGAGPRTLRVRAEIAGEEVSWSVPVALPEVDDANPELERLYGLAAIADLERAAFLEGDELGETRRAIVDLAVAYGLVTEHTSMVIVEDSRKSTYGLGYANADQRAREEAAASARANHGDRLQVGTGGAPLGGSRVAHAPARVRGRRSEGGGGGALGPLELASAFGLALLALGRGSAKRAPDVEEPPRRS